MENDGDTFDANHVGLRMRACQSSYVVVSVIAGVPIFFGIYALIGTRNLQLLPSILLFGAFYAVAVFWLRGFEVTLKEDTVTIRQFMRRKMTIYVPEIIYFRFENGYDQDGARRSEPPFRLVFRTRNATGTHRYSVNAKVFRMAELRKFINAVTNRMTPDLPREC